MPGKTDKAIERIEGFDKASGPDTTVIRIGYFGTKTRRLEEAVELMRAKYPGAEIELVDMKNAPRKGARDR